MIIFTWFSISFGTEIDNDVFSVGKRNDGTIHAWVMFKDKNVTQHELSAKLSDAESQLDFRTKYRRSKVRQNTLVDEKDIPVSQDYIQLVKDQSCTIRVVSKWLNAVSVEGTSDAIYRLSELECVEKIRPVLAGKRREDILNQERTHLSARTSTFYGSSFAQLNQINVIEAHEAGYTGQGVIVLMLDTGYYKDHEAIQNDKIIGEWDFINNDSETQNEIDDPTSQHNHGTYTLSALGGRKDSVLIGPAYNSEFLLAKTEDVADEQPIEEDYYVAGLEWGEANGADIASSSLGYIDWYQMSDLDGLTAVTTIAVNQAIENGMIITTAAGNSGASGIIAPADAFDVITCGAVDSLGEIASFSSWGPTADGRIKPELCARGVYTYCAGAYFPEYYLEANGTSLSTPLIGGACAVILSARPDWTPSMVREALMMTADHSESPNNQYGWGIIDVMAAINYTGFASIAESDPVPTRFAITDPFPNPFNSTVSFSVMIQEEGDLIVDMINIRGEVIETLWNGFVRTGYHDHTWESDQTSSGMFFIRATLNNQTSVRKISLIK